MDLRELKGKFVVLNYSFGPYWNEELGGEDVLTVWGVYKGEFVPFYHPGEPDIVDNERVIQLMKKKGIREVYTPSLDLYLETNRLFGLEMRNDGGEHFDEDGVTDWFKYKNIVEGEGNWDLLKESGIEIIIFS